MDDLSFFDYFKSILFFVNEFYCTFPYLIKYNNIVFIIIIIIIFSLLTFFVCFFILFRSCCSHAQVFGKTLVHEFPNSYSYTEWYLVFPTVQLHVHNVYSERKSGSTLALVYLNL